MKHNKKRNTAFLYECLIKELTRAIVRENKKRQKVTKNILRQFFSNNSELRKELELYNSLLECNNLDENFSKRLLEESKKDFYGLDRKEIFNAQTKLINKITNELGSSTFSNFIPNYKDIASVGLFFQNNKLPAKKRLMLESNLVNFLTRKNQTINELKHLDNLEYRTFVNKFNSTYQNTLRTEQKDLLTNYIVSFSDNGVGLKCFLNEEIGRLKKAVSKELVEGSNNEYLQNFKKLKDKLDGYAKTPINHKMIEEIFYIQDLLSEVNKK